ncbi:MAG: hypothetical protein LM580_07640 [Thermofilum sp.]|nr:hypothetical protein [Thermofilum sp.]
MLDSSAVRECVRKILRTCDFLDEGRERDLLEEVQARGEAVLRDCVEKLERLLDDPCLDQLLAWRREEYRKTVRRRLLAARKRLQGEPEVEVAWSTSTAYEGEEVTAAISVYNPRATPVKCKLTFSGDFELVEAPREAEVPPLEGRVFDIRVRPRGAGSKKLSVKVGVEGSYPAAVAKELSLEVRPFKPALEAEVLPAAQGVEEGEVIELKVRLRNRGTVPLKVEATHPYDGSTETFALEPGEELTASLRVKAPGSGSVKLPPLKYTDPRGNLHSVNLGEVQLKVKPREKPEKREERAEERARVEEKRGAPPPPPPQPTVDLEGLLSQAAAHAIAALVGKMLGERMPEKREFPKPVIVQDLPFHVRDDVTVVLEDPAAVVEEDRGSYVLVRRARPAELEHVVTAETARALVGNFKLAAESALRSWRPFPEAEVSRKERRASEGELKELAKRRRVRVEKLEEELPINFYIEYTFSTGGIRRKALLKVYAGSYSRLSTLCERGRDDEPADVGGAVKELELPKPAGEHPTIYLLASPTGWDPSSRKLADGSSNPLYILVNLKTGELYYNKREPLASGLAEELRRALGHAGPPLYSEEVLNLDKRLLKGEISEEFYERAREELVKKSVQK